MQLCPQESDLCSASTIPEPTDLSRVPPDCHNFADVFSKSKADMLAPHCEHNLKINLEDSASPPLRATYSLSSSAHATPVLFVCKKNSSLCLCVDFRGLNTITKKDRYPLPRISDLLDTPSRAKVYTKIDRKSTRLNSSHRP